MRREYKTNTLISTSTSLLSRTYHEVALNYNRKQVKSVDKEADKRGYSSGRIRIRTKSGNSLLVTTSEEIKDLLIYEIWKSKRVIIDDDSIVSPELPYYSIYSAITDLKLFPHIIENPFFGVLGGGIDYFFLFDHRKLEKSEFRGLTQFAESNNFKLTKVDVSFTEEEPNFNISDEEENHLIESLYYIYKNLEVYQKAVALELADIVKSFYLALSIVINNIDFNTIVRILNVYHNEFNREYENIDFIFRGKLTTDLNYLKDFLTKAEILKDAFEKSEYSDLINSGESNTVEFKSSLRFDIKNMRIDKNLELQVFKSIAAFLNSKGGTLFIGVEDDGNIIGIENDGLKNDDKYLLYLIDKIARFFKPNISSLVDMRIIEISNKKVCMINCIKSQLPVYLLFDKSEDFYIRSGPSSRKLKPSEMIEYIKNTFPNF